MAGPSFDVHVRFDADTGGLRRTSSDAASAGQSVSDLKRQIVGLVGAYLTLNTAATQIRKVVTESSAAQEAAFRLDQIVGRMGSTAGVTSDRLKQLAGEIQSATRFSDEAVMGAEATLLRFGRIRGETVERALKASADFAFATSRDIESATQLVGKSLEVPGEGLRALAQAGIVFSDAQKKVIENLVNTGRGAEAQVIILKELEKRFQGAAVAGGQLLGDSLTRLGNVAGELYEIVGEGGVSGAVKRFADRMQALAEDPAIKETFREIGKDLGVFIDAVTEAAATWLPRLASALGVVADNLGAIVSAAKGLALYKTIIGLTEAAAGAKVAYEAWLKGIEDGSGRAALKIGLIAAAVAIVVAGLDRAINRWKELSDLRTAAAIAGANAEGRMLVFAQTVAKTGAVTRAQLVQAEKDLAAQAQVLAQAKADVAAALAKQSLSAPPDRPFKPVADPALTARVQQAAQVYDRLKAAIGGVNDVIDDPEPAKQLEETINILEALQDAWKEASAIAKAFASGAVKGAKDLAVLNRAVELGLDPVVALAGGYGNLVRRLVDLEQANEAAAAVIELTDAVSRAHGELIILSSGLVRTADDVVVMTRAIEMGLDPVVALAGGYGGLVQELIHLERKVELLKSLPGIFAESAGRFAVTAETLRKQFAALVPKLELPELEANPETAGQIKGITEDLSESVRRYQAGEWTRLWEDVATSASRALGSGLKSLTDDLLDGNLRSWEDWGDAIVDIAKNIAQSVLGTFTDLLTQIILDWAKRKIVASVVTGGGGGGNVVGSAASGAAAAAGKAAVTGSSLTATGSAVAAILGTVAVIGAAYLIADKLLDRQKKKQTSATVTLGAFRPDDFVGAYKSDALNDAMVQIYRDTLAAFKQLEDITGGTIRAVERIKINVKGTGEAFVHIGEMVRRFSNVADAVDFARRELLRTAQFAGLPAEIVKLFQEGNQSWEELAGDLDVVLRSLGQTLTAAGQEVFAKYAQFASDVEVMTRLKLPSGEILKTFLDELKELADDPGYEQAIEKLRLKIVREIEALRLELENLLKGGSGGGGRTPEDPRTTGNRPNLGGPNTSTPLSSQAAAEAAAVETLAESALRAAELQGEALRSHALSAGQAASLLSGYDEGYAEQLRRRIAELEALLGQLPAATKPKGQGGGGGQRKNDLERLGEILADVALAKLPDLERALAEVALKWDENAKLAHGNADRLRQVAEARREENDAIIAGGIKDAYGQILDLEGISAVGSAADEIRERASAAREAFLAAAKAAGFGADRIAKGLGRIEAAEGKRLQALSDESASGLATALADIVTDETIRRNLLHHAEVINLTLRLEALRTEYAALVALGRLAPEVEAALVAAFGWIDANLPAILAGLGTPANDNAPDTSRPLYEFSNAVQSAADAAADAARRLEEIQRPLIDLRRQLDLGQAGTGGTPDQILRGLQARAAELMASYNAATRDTQRLAIQEQLGAILPDLISAADNAGSSASVTQWVSAALDRLGIPRYLPTSAGATLSQNAPRGVAATPQELIDSNTLREIHGAQLRTADAIERLSNRLIQAA